MQALTSSRCVKQAAAGRLGRATARAGVRASLLSSRSAACSPAVFSSLQAQVAAAPGMERVCQLVCEARSGREQPETVFEALRAVELPAALRPAVAAAVCNALLAAPAMAEAGKIFDFNATLPLMAGQFLVLMVVMDKLVYQPVSKVLDERDSVLRTKLEAVKDNSGDLMKFTEEADGIIREARNDAGAVIQKAKNEADAESAKRVATAKAKLDAELKAAITALNAQRTASLAGVDAEVTKLSDYIVKKLVPV